MSELRPYEVMYIVRPDLSEELIQDVADKFRRLVLDAGGEVERLELVGLRRLAYQIGQFTEGVYILMLFRAPGPLIQSLKREFRLDERVVREMLIVRSKQALAHEARVMEAVAAQQAAPESEPEPGAVEVEAAQPEEVAGEEPIWAEEPQPEAGQLGELEESERPNEEADEPGVEG